VKYVKPVTLNKVLRDGKFQKKLFLIGGATTISIKEVPCTYQSLSKRDVFVLDNDDIIFQWNGSKSSRLKKGKALDFTIRLRDERAGKPKIIVLDELGEDDKEFWDTLGGKGVITDYSSNTASPRAERSGGTKLYSVEIENGELTLKLEDLVSSSKLLSGGCSILDCGNEIFVWQGKGSLVADRAAAHDKAKDLGSRAENTSVVRIMQGCETTIFKSKFQYGKWDEHVETYNPIVKGNIAKKREQDDTGFIVDKMHHPEKYALAREERNDAVIFPLAGTHEGELAVHIVKEHMKHPIPPKEYGVFFKGMCYIVLYTFRLKDGGVRHVLYFWQGRSASQDDSGSCALLAKELAHSIGNSCTQCRVEQDKEPEHFLSHFAGKFIVKNGKREGETDLFQNGLFQITGSAAPNIRALEVDLDSGSLNSNGVFIVFTPRNAIIWVGKGSPKEGKKFASDFIDSISKEVATVLEGDEDNTFWKVVGPKQEYYSQIRLQRKCRLFQCSAAIGTFEVEEIAIFSQSDLDDKDVMILDNGYEVFVWIGANSREKEQKMGLETAMDYVQTGGDASKQVFVVHSGNEPQNFTVDFVSWDNDKPTDPSAYIEKLQKIMVKLGLMFETNSVDLISLAKTNKSEREKEGGADDGSGNGSDLVFSYERLKKKPSPEGIDTKNLHLYLAPDEFLRLFKMTRDQFEKLPPWRKIETRKT